MLVSILQIFVFIIAPGHPDLAMVQEKAGEVTRGANHDQDQRLVLLQIHILGVHTAGLDPVRLLQDQGTTI